MQGISKGAPQPEAAYLTGKLLLAMPNMSDARFERSVICICEHNEEGAMGLMVNRPADHITFEELIEQLEINPTGPVPDLPVMEGGPVEPNRGFVLHSTDFLQDSSLKFTPDMALTATVDILKAISCGAGPKRHVLALGYAGWGPGQLENEIQANGWLHTDADTELVFNTDPDMSWLVAMSSLGIELPHLSHEAGHA